MILSPGMIKIHSKVTNWERQTMFSKYLYTLILLFLTFVSISVAFIYFESRFEEAKVACSTPPTINSAAASHQSDIERERLLAERFSCLEELANSEQGRVAIELAEIASWKQLTIPVSEALGALLLLSILLGWAWKKRSSNSALWVITLESWQKTRYLTVWELRIFSRSRLIEKDIRYRVDIYRELDCWLQ